MLHITGHNKKIILGVIWSVVAVCWLIAGPVFFATDSSTTAILALTVAAVITEAAFWVSALLLGIALVDARKALWKKVTGKATKIQS